MTIKGNINEITNNNNTLFVNQEDTWLTVWTYQYNNGIKLLLEDQDHKRIYFTVFENERACLEYFSKVRFYNILYCSDKEVLNKIVVLKIQENK